MKNNIFTKPFNINIMNKYLVSLILVASLVMSVVAQSPSKISYQAVIRNANNALVSNQAVGVRISILQGSVNGTSVYTETQTPITNANGLISLEIGNETAFDAINWGIGSYFIKTETDPTGGTKYTIVGTSQLLSVPYALYAKTSGSSTPGPQGIQGIAGSQGIQGDQGIQGVKGDIGLTGAKGAQGIQGVKGDIGLTGVKGDQGIQGVKGDIGLTGTKGDQGIQGIKGDIGLTGAKGDQGIQGVKGDVGLTGAKGDQGLQGVKGDKGDQGIAGNSNQATVDSLKTLIAYMQSVMLNSGAILKDYDGNIYKTITINGTNWMAENYKASHDRNGDTILGTFTLNNTPSNVDLYGRLYTKTTQMINTGCPNGWRLPTSTDYSNLITYLGGAAGTSTLLRDNSFNTGTNKYGFSALKSGMQNYIGSTFTTTLFAMLTANAAYVTLQDGSNNIIVVSDVNLNGLSVRCIR
jgi:uncharacterized protein (TIGR02145 family)